MHALDKPMLVVIKHRVIKFIVKDDVCLCELALLWIVPVLHHAAFYAAGLANIRFFTVRKNVEHCCKTIERSIVIQKDEQKYGLRVVGAIYDIETGEVVFY